MKHTSMLKAIITAQLLFFAIQHTVLAGQVVTDLQRQWARQALENEKAGADRMTVPPPNTLAVLYLNNKSGEKQWHVLQKGLAVMLITDLARVDSLEVVERIKLQALLDEMELSASGLAASRYAPRMGNLLGVCYVAGGDILKGQSTDLVIDPSILDVPDATMLNQPYAYGNLSELIVVEKKLLFDIIRTMEIELTPQEKRELEKPISISAAALMALFTAIDLSDGGEYARAAEAYARALNHDPELSLARQSLQELRDLGLINTTGTAAESPGASEPAAAASGGSTIGKVLVGGLVLAAVGGGVALALGGSEDEDDNVTPGPEPEPEPEPEPTPSPEPEPEPEAGPEIENIIPAPGSNLDCAGGQIIFDFTEPMDRNSNPEVRFLGSQFDFGFVLDWARGDTRLNVSYSNDYPYCDSGDYSREEEIQVELLRFQNLSGTPLSGPDTFDYTIIYRELG